MIAESKDIREETGEANVIGQDENHINPIKYVLLTNWKTRKVRCKYLF